MEYIIYRDSDELYHHGVKGMKWGIRRYQKEDGSLTRMGRFRYGTEEKRTAKQWARMLNDESHGSLAAEVNSKIMQDNVELWKQKQSKRNTRGKELKPRHVKYLNESMEAAKKYLEDSKNMRSNVNNIISKIPKDLTVTAVVGFKDQVWSNEVVIPGREPLLLKYPSGYNPLNRGINRTSWYDPISGYENMIYYDNDYYKVKR